MLSPIHSAVRKRNEKLVPMYKNLSVVMHEIPFRFDESSDISCTFTLKDYKIHEGDRIGVFELGATALKPYTELKSVDPACTESTLTYSFNDFFRNVDLEEEPYYQFLYMNRSNVILGASTPFQVSSKTSLKSSDTRSLQDRNSEETKKLKAENYLLKDSLRAMVQTQKLLENSPRNERELNDLRECIHRLAERVSKQEQQIQQLQRNESSMAEEIVELKKQISSQQNQLKMVYKTDKDPKYNISDAKNTVPAYAHESYVYRKQAESAKAQSQQILAENLILRKKFNSLYEKNEQTDVTPKSFEVDFDELQPIPAFPNLSFH